MSWTKRNRKEDGRVSLGNGRSNPWPSCENAVRILCNPIISAPDTGTEGTMANLRRNRGELAEGWYDPQTLRKAQSAANDPISPSRPPMSAEVSQEDMSEDNDDDGYGPALPSESDQRKGRARTLKQPGPSIPNLQDLEYQRGISTVISRPCARRLLVLP